MAPAEAETNRVHAAKRPRCAALTDAAGRQAPLGIPRPARGPRNPHRRLTCHRFSLFLVGGAVLFKGAPAMGIQKIWPALGKSASKTNHHGKVHVPTIGKEVGVELAGLAFQMAVKVCQAPFKAKAVREHASGKDLSDPEVVLVIAGSVVTEIVRLAWCCGTLIVVWEGNFPLKRHESGRRAAGRVTKVKTGKWSQALSITACMIELIKRWVVEKLGPASWIDPPGEGEVQLTCMLETRQLDVVLGHSGDSDFAVCSGGHVPLHV